MLQLALPFIIYIQFSQTFCLEKKKQTNKHKTNQTKQTNKNQTNKFIQITWILELTDVYRLCDVKLFTLMFKIGC